MLERVENYFRPADRGWWRYDEDGFAVVTQAQETVAFLLEVREILRALCPSGWPPFDVVVRILAACRGVGDHGLPVVRTLPEERRVGVEAKVALLQLALERTALAFEPGEAEMAFAIWNASELDLPNLRAGERRVDADDPYLDLGARLEFILRRGFAGEVTPVDLPVLPESMHSLLGELANDEHHAGLARLAHDVRPWLHVWYPLDRVQELRIGGLSDLTNRGRLDRLLLSELAQDDDVLAARVAMGEALYLEREPPRARPVRQRLIAIDTGLRLWGLPRLFATSVAMALAELSTGPAYVWHLREDAFHPVRLDVREELERHLEVLSPQLDPGPALDSLWQRYLERHQGAHDVDLILITSAATLRDDAFLTCLPLAHGVRLLIATVERDGAFTLNEMRGRVARPVRSAHLSLARLNPRDRLRSVTSASELPAIFQARPFPFLMHVKPENRRSVVRFGDAVYAVPGDGRLLAFEMPRRGGRLVREDLSEGRAVLIGRWDGSLHMVIQPPGRRPLLAHVPLRDDPIEETALQVGSGAWEAALIHEDGLLLIADRETILVDARTGLRLDRQVVPGSWQGTSYEFRQPPITRSAASGQGSRDDFFPTHDNSRIIWQRGRLQALATGPEGRFDQFAVRRKVAFAGHLAHRALVIGSKRNTRVLHVEGGKLTWVLTREPARLEPLRRVPHERPYALVGVSYANGRRILFDRRGLLHLTGAGPEIPDVTLTLCDEHAAAWIADGTMHGPEYNLGDHPSVPAATVQRHVRAFVEGLP